ncbi:inosamine-phosphate amidinotransferase 1 [bacterium]|nr:inosamine-phosphate amidinotransferase 1 [Candidatus Elulimicrobium humile]
MLSDTEYRPLKSVIVGDATGARLPNIDISIRTTSYADKNDNELPRSGMYPQQVIDETNEDLEIFCDFLVKENIEVLRPSKDIEPGYYHYCPRDLVLTYRNQAIATPCPIRSRSKDWLAFAHHLEKYIEPNEIIIERQDNLYNTKCLGDPDTLALNETEPCFDAANILRDGDNLYYLVSNTGNQEGARLLQRWIPNSKVWPITDVYSYVHIDSTIAILREGLVLCNPSRVKRKDQLPKPLQEYDIIWSPEPVDIGHYPGICNASAWVNVNLFSINPTLVVLEKHQEPLRKELEKYGIDCAMLPLRHARTLGGCFHCVTLDLIRE